MTCTSLSLAHLPRIARLFTPILPHLQFHLPLSSLSLLCRCCCAVYVLGTFGAARCSRASKVHGVDLLALFILDHALLIVAELDLVRASKLDAAWRGV